MSAARTLSPLQRKNARRTYIYSSLLFLLVIYGQCISRAPCGIDWLLLLPTRAAAAKIPLSLLCPGGRKNRSVRYTCIASYLPLRSAIFRGCWSCLLSVELWYPHAMYLYTQRNGRCAWVRRAAGQHVRG